MNSEEAEPYRKAMQRDGKGWLMSTKPEKLEGEIAALTKLDEAAVDTADLTDGADWSKGVRVRFFRQKKKSVTIRIDRLRPGGQ